MPDGEPMLVAVAVGQAAMSRPAAMQPDVNLRPYGAHVQRRQDVGFAGQITIQVGANAQVQALPLLTGSWPAVNAGACDVALG